MSTNTSTQRAESGWRRDNWHGSPEVTPVAATHGHDTDADEYRREKSEWVAHKILREVATKLCPIARFEPPFKPGLFGLDAGHVSNLAAWMWGGDQDRIDSDPLALHRVNCDIELTDPELHIAKTFEGTSVTIDYGHHGHRSRFNPEHGYVTGPYLSDVGEEEFLTVVDLVLQNALAENMILSTDVSELRRDAQRMKQTPDYDDETALSLILEDIYAAAE